MRSAENLQRQHKKLQAMAAELVSLAARPRPDVSLVRRALARFSGTLHMHATMEEEGLYPSLLDSRDPEVRRTAERLYRDLGGLYAMWDEFVARWDDPETIRKRPTRFRFDLGRVLLRLGMRMRREDRELYPMALRATKSDLPPFE